MEKNIGGLDLDLLRCFFWHVRVDILKKEENEIWFVNNKVIKFSKSDKVIKNIIKRNRLLHNYTPKITNNYPNLFCYNKVKGQVISRVLNNTTFAKLLRFSQDRFFYDLTKYLYNSLLKSF